MSAAERHGWSFGRLLASELRLIFGRRRNQFGMLVLAAVPLIMAIAMRSEASLGGLLSGNGLIVPVTAMMAEAPFFLPMAVSMLAGDAIAGEANLGTLRYLLTLPAGRTRLLAAKFASLVIGCLTGSAIVGTVGVIAGAVALGVGPTWLLSGSQVSFGAALGKVVLIYLYATAMLIGTASIGLLVSTLTDQPLAATVAILIINILSWIAVAVEQLDWLHPWLLSNWMMASFTDLLSDPMMTTNVSHGLRG